MLRNRFTHKEIENCFRSIYKINNPRCILCKYNYISLKHDYPILRTDGDVRKTFDELLDNIRIESCEINTKVVNHLFQKDEFETFGIAFNFDINKIVNQVNHHTSFRTSENVVCCDEEGNEIVPDFSIRKRPGENTKFPYLKMNIK